MPPTAPRETAETDDGPDGVARKHVRSEREHVRGPALVAGRGKTDERHREPEIAARSRRTRSGTTHSAQMSIAVLRAALTLQPRLMKRPASQPPPMLPTSASR